MSFNAMGFVMSREMAKRELGSGKEDRANQLGLVGAIMPDFMMGTIIAIMMARNDGSALSITPQTQIPVTPPAPSGQRLAAYIDGIRWTPTTDVTIEFPPSSWKYIQLINIGDSDVRVKFPGSVEGYGFWDDNVNVEQHPDVNVPRNSGKVIAVQSFQRPKKKTLKLATSENQELTAVLMPAT